MRKYLVNVHLPSVGRHYDVLLPAGKKIGEATMLLIEVAESLTKGSYKGTTHSVLLCAKSGEPIKPDITVYDAGIRNSSELILI